MTRVNLVDPKTLMDQHLFAEFREIKMISAALGRSLKNNTLESLLKKIPARFTLGKGHVTFFYDKGQFLKKRFEAIKKELDHRNYNYDKSSQIDKYGNFDLDERLNKDYTPTEEEIEISEERIRSRIAQKPEWYRFSRRE